MNNGSNGNGSKAPISFSPPPLTLPLQDPEQEILRLRELVKKLEHDLAAERERNHTLTIRVAVAERPLAPAPRPKER